LKNENPDSGERFFGFFFSLGVRLFSSLLVVCEAGTIEKVDKRETPGGLCKLTNPMASIRQAQKRLARGNPEEMG